jgi:hypothetical protein
MEAVMTHPQGNFQAKKATLYVKNEFLGNVQRVEVREVRVSRQPWAQYKSAVICKYLLPRKRNWRKRTESYLPYLVVLEGWGHPDPASPWTNIQQGNGVTTSQGRHSSCSTAWDTDFDGELARYLEANPKAKVLGDYRHTQGCNTHDPAPAEEYLTGQIESLNEGLQGAGFPPELAHEVSTAFVRRSPQTAAGIALAADFWVDTTFKNGRYAIEYNGQLIAPKAF